MLPHIKKFRAAPWTPARGAAPWTPPEAAAPEPPQYASIRTNSNKRALRTIRTCSMFSRKHLVTKSILLHLNYIGDTKAPTILPHLSVILINLNLNHNKQQTDA